MDTISDFYSQKEQIDSLEKRIKSAIERSVYWRNKYHKLNAKIGVKKPLSKTKQAVLLIKSKSENNMLLKQIASKCHLAVGTVEKLSIQVNKGLI